MEGHRNFSADWLDFGYVGKSLMYSRNTPPGNFCQKCGRRMGNIVASMRWRYYLWEDETGRRSLIGYCHDYDCLRDLDEDERRERIG